MKYNYLYIYIYHIILDHHQQLFRKCCSVGSGSFSILIIIYYVEGSCRHRVGLNPQPFCSSKTCAIASGSISSFRFRKCNVCQGIFMYLLLLIIENVVNTP